MEDLTLDQLAVAFGTDKSSKGHAYTQYYSMLFEPMRHKPLKILEIGVWEGASLKMWKDYFDRGEIFGIDNVAMTQYDEGRIKTFVCDQGSEEQLTRLANMLPTMDVIIDDGSHEGIHQWTSFNTLFPYLKDGGLYVIEDLLCSYDGRWNYPLDFKNKLREMVDQINFSGAIPNSHICANKKEAVKKYYSDYLSEHIEWTLMACGIVFIKKI